MNRLQEIAKTNPKFIVFSERPLLFVPVEWTQKLRDSNFGESEAAPQRLEKLNSDTQSSVPRSAKECKERDDHKCVLTGKPNPDAAHIFPYYMINPRSKADRNKMFNGVPEFWTSLRIFWDENRVNKWKRTIFQDHQHQNPYASVDRCFNLISLSVETHDMWKMGMFALKPLQLSSDRLDFVEGYFLPRIQGDGSTPRICSGEILTLTTKDPENLPLPSLELLEMKWFLQRLVGMSGAARYPILDFDDDESEDDSSWSAPERTPDVDNSLEMGL
ncbi:uncharacterized protein Z518_00440 [Rhinocladiella mackenziei CBS 650.93]|uniref:HNH nuclease domain-containing protein n=1 Tax=Rhinocladiella mackenziei CBS 650.93 TaxID=1442369 RepID=A0A0D2J0Y8_9EURO|nr:uncharacterized protein Z518_00440 [Rhinocladiella mackenziei CBS 650.93]KIX09361.1 hypothetical protein Z518_00440 [Rhinocladiella mackenziei CBS 650.93]